MTSDAALNQTTQSISNQILPQYGIEAKTVELLAELNEHVFRVVDHDNRQYVLRLQNPNGLSDNAIRTQINWLNAILADTDIVVPKAISTTSGRPFGMIELSQQATPYRFILLNWLDGERKPTPDDWVEHDNLFLIGRVVAQLHEHSQRYGVPQDSDVPSLSSENFLGKTSILRNNDLEPHLGEVGLKTFHLYMENVQSALQTCVEKDEERGLIHADLGPHNWLFHHESPRLIDFDAFAVGYFVHDLLGVLWSHCHWKANDTYVKSLFAGYETVWKISDDVKANVFILQAAHCFMWINWVLSLKPEAQAELVPHIPHQVKIIEQLCEATPA